MRRAGKNCAAAVVLTILLVLPMAAVVSAQPTADHAETDSYLIGAGDVLTVNVWKNEDVSGEYLVRPDGRITLPLVGDIIAAGKTTDSVKMQVEAKLRMFIEEPYVSVIVTRASSNVVYILGKVARPGAYPLQDRLSVLQALALAGGFTEFARTGDMVLVRMEGDGQRRFQISYKKILNSEDASGNLILQRGDTLVVP